MIQKPEEFFKLLKIVAEKKPKIILEIGIWDGGTLREWAEICDLVIGIDTYRSNVGNFFDSQREAIVSNIPNLILIKGNSHDDRVSKQLENILDSKWLDCLFIDGDHSYEGVRSDYLLYSQFVKSGGFIAFHDIVESDYHKKKNCFVYQLWNALKKFHSNTLEFVEEPKNWGGIGVIKIIK